MRCARCGKTIPFDKNEGYVYGMVDLVCRGEHMALDVLCEGCARALGAEVDAFMRATPEREAAAWLRCGICRMGFLSEDACARHVVEKHGKGGREARRHLEYF